MPSIGRITGYGTFWGRPHWPTGAFAPTVLQPGAFAGADPQQVKLLLQHRPEEMIGQIISLAQDDRGLRYVAEIADTQAGREAVELIRTGAYRAVSLGFMPITYRVDLAAIWVERALPLELSLVPWPAMPGTTVELQASSPDELAAVQNTATEKSEVSTDRVDPARVKMLRRSASLALERALRTHVGSGL